MAFDKSDHHHNASSKDKAPKQPANQWHNKSHKILGTTIVKNKIVRANSRIGEKKSGDNKSDVDVGISFKNRNTHQYTKSIPNNQWHNSKRRAVSNSLGNHLESNNKKKRKANSNSNTVGSKRHRNVSLNKGLVPHLPRQNLKWVKEDTQPYSDLNESLQSTLSAVGAFENNEGSQRRVNVLDELEKLLCTWSKSVSQDRNSDMPSTVSTSQITIVRLISFGSFRLGVHSPQSDLDVLALCPPQITRSDFFSSLVDTLRDNQYVKGVHPIPSAFTPVIKFIMKDIKVDLLFVRLIDGEKLLHADSNQNDAVNEIPNKDSLIVLKNQRYEFELDDSMLVGLDEPSVRSLNGVRVAQFLLNVIPDKVNYCIVLRTVKKWASAHGLYSNVLGFFGGINWALLVAWVCVRNVSATPATLLKLFFQTWARWRWPSPVLLTPIEEHPPVGVMQLTVWNPKTNVRDRAHLMPIITPVYPSMNSSYNVGIPQKRRLSQAFSLADKMMSQIAEGSLQWSELLKGNDFFNDHGHYIEVKIISTNTKDHLSWFRFCESRLRLLIAGLESPSHGSSAYPFAKFFTRMNKISEEDQTGNSKMVTSFFIGLEFSIPVDTVVDIRSCIEEFVQIANSWEGRKSGMDLEIEHILQNDLPSYVTQNDSVDLEQLELEEAIDILDQKSM